MPDKIPGFGGVLRTQAEGMVFILCVCVCGLDKKSLNLSCSF